MAGARSMAVLGDEGGDGKDSAEGKVEEEWNTDYGLTQIDLSHPHSPFGPRVLGTLFRSRCVRYAFGRVAI